MDHVIEIKGLRKVYRDFWYRPKVIAIDRLDMEVKKGEIFGFLGPNGSGKTTALKLMLGLIFPTSGKIRILGKVPTDVRIKEQIGYMPEESYLYGFLNADETLDFYGKLNGIPRARRKERIEKVLDIVGLKHARKRRLSDYSKGMSRRISLAQVLLKDPALVLLDEPTIGLDPVVSREVKDVILGLKSEGKTVVLSSHLLSEVQTVCDKIAILCEGKLIKEGNVDELLTVNGETEIVASGLKQEDISRIKDVISSSGGKFISSGHPKETLEGLFIKSIKEKQESKSN